MLGTETQSVIFAFVLPNCTVSIFHINMSKKEFKQKPQGTSKLPTSRGFSSYNFDTPPFLQNIHRRTLAAPQGG